MRQLLAGAIALAIMFPATSFAGGGNMNDCNKYGGSWGGSGCSFQPAQPMQPPSQQTWNSNQNSNYNQNSNHNSNSNYNTNNNYNSNSNYNSNRNSNYNNNQAYGGNAKAYGGNANAYSNANARASGGTSNVNVSGAGNSYEKVNVPPPAYAPSMVGGPVPNGSCRTGVSGSAGGGGIVSLGFGSTELDDECEMRYNIQLVSTFNPALAEEMTNDLKGVKEARERMPPAPPPQQIVYVPQPQQAQPQQQPYPPLTVIDNTPQSPPRIVTPTQADQEPGS